MATQLPLQNNWSYARNKLKESYGILTDDDLRYEPGRENELCEHLSRRLQLEPDKVKRMLESFGG